MYVVLCSHFMTLYHWRPLNLLKFSASSYFDRPPCLLKVKFSFFFSLIYFFKDPKIIFISPHHKMGDKMISKNHSSERLIKFPNLHNPKSTHHILQGVILLGIHVKFHIFSIEKRFLTLLFSLGLFILIN